MKRILTLGYTGLTLPALQAWLDQHDALLVDVRHKPFSRAAEWRQKALQRALGTRYRHVPELGNLNYRGGPIKLADQAEGVQIVSALLQENSVVLLCVCADYARCHRTAAANAISKAVGARVEHLSSSDLITAGQLDLI